MTAPTPDEAAALHPMPWRDDDDLGWVVDADGNEVCHADSSTTARFIVAALAERDALRARVAELEQIEQRARDVYDHPDEHPLAAHTAARHILGGTA